MAVSKLSAKQPWTAVWTPGVNLVNFYNLYDSKGDVTISTATSIPTTLDGPIQVARYGALTVNAALSASQRCRGLMPLCDSLSVGAAGSISMTARGAAGSKNWAVDRDIFVPQSITFTGRNTSYADFLKWIRQTGYCIFDPTLYACPLPGMGDVTCDWATWTPYGSTIISAAGCGIGGAYSYAAVTGSYQGASGTAGVSGAPGGGGAGRYNGPSSAAVNGGGANGHRWGGGAGGGGSYNSSSAALTRSAHPDGGIAGVGASAGDGGLGGGILIVIALGSVSLTGGHALTANGLAGTTVNSTEGGGGGGGSVAMIYGGSLTGTPNLTASGGTPNGGAGSTQAKTFAYMGWS